MKVLPAPSSFGATAAPAATARAVAPGAEVKPAPKKVDVALKLKPTANTSTSAVGKPLGSGRRLAPGAAAATGAATAAGSAAPFLSTPVFGLAAQPNGGADLVDSAKKDASKPGGMAYRFASGATNSELMLAEAGADHAPGDAMLMAGFSAFPGAAAVPSAGIFFGAAAADKFRAAAAFLDSDDDPQPEAKPSAQPSVARSTVSGAISGVYSIDGGDGGGSSSSGDGGDDNGAVNAAAAASESAIGDSDDDHTPPAADDGAESNAAPDSPAAGGSSPRAAGPVTEAYELDSEISRLEEDLAQAAPPPGGAGTVVGPSPARFALPAGEAPLMQGFYTPMPDAKKATADGDGDEGDHPMLDVLRTPDSQRILDSPEAGGVADLSLLPGRRGTSDKGGSRGGSRKGVRKWTEAAGTETVEETGTHKARGGPRVSHAAAARG